MFRKAEPRDLDAIAAIYDRIHDNEEAGKTTIGWIRSIYPTRQTAEDAIGAGDLFVQTDEGRIVAAGRINQVQVPEYADAAWAYSAPDDEVMVLHTLVVSPRAKGKGYGTKFVAFYEQYALENGCHYLRMNTNERNREAALSAEMRWHAQRDGGVIPPQGKQVFIQLLQNHILHHLLGLTSETK